MKCILITTDFTDHSKHAINYVLSFVRDTSSDCKIVLLNTYKVQHSNPDQILSENDALKEKSKIGLHEERLEALKTIDNSHISIDTISQMGSLNNVIRQMFQKYHIDLVAMGEDDGENISKILPVLKEQGCPILVTSLKRSS